MDDQQRTHRIPIRSAVGTACGVLLIVVTSPCTVWAQAGRPLPSHVDLTLEFERLGLSAHAQGKRDVCSLFAITALASFENGRAHPGQAAPLSEEFLIWAAKASTGKSREQAMFYEAIHGLNTDGICRADLMPYSPNEPAAERPSPQALAEARLRGLRWRAHWIKRWNVRERLSDAQMEAIQHALANHHPVACGLRWPKEMKGDRMLAVPPENEVFDGHSIALVGYDVEPGKGKKGVFRFRNSMGPKWGDRGYGLLSFAYVRTYANDALWLQEERPRGEKPITRFEAESLPIRGVQGGQATVQDMGEFEGRLWSRSKQLYFHATGKGAFVDLGYAAHQPGRYRVRVLATAAPDYGDIEIWMDGKRVGPIFDLYSGRVCPSGSLELGTHDLAGGEHRIRFVARGKDRASGGRSFGIDAIDLLTPE